MNEPKPDVTFAQTILATRSQRSLLAHKEQEHPERTYVDTATIQAILRHHNERHVPTLTDGMAYFALKRLFGERNFGIDIGVGWWIETVTLQKVQSGRHIR